MNKDCLSLFVASPWWRTLNTGESQDKGHRDNAIVTSTREPEQMKELCRWELEGKKGTVSVVV